eukprot:TRINITY_DN1249_c0_g1_i1.p1 TRINITY_DN1249_c0_g1~~TRINITY_DN1249_c0_g1_i1.p1  ORF type:complete len:223 (+),score=53.60 TRINITY_DN1249_c0_g1_i1:171-839(+)
MGKRKVLAKIPFESVRKEMSNDKCAYDTNNYPPCLQNLFAFDEFQSLLRDLSDLVPSTGTGAMFGKVIVLMIAIFFCFGLVALAATTLPGLLSVAGFVGGFIVSSLIIFFLFRYLFSTSIDGQMKLFYDRLDPVNERLREYNIGFYVKGRFYESRSVRGKKGRRYKQKIELYDWNIDIVNGPVARKFEEIEMIDTSGNSHFVTASGTIDEDPGNNSIMMIKR